MQLPMAKPVNCDGCGLCCEHVGTPPGFAVFYPPPGQALAEWSTGMLDHDIWQNMPVHLREELGAYYRQVRAGETPDRSARDVPCLWYDADTKRCRNYEHRPEVCRTFAVGGSGCMIVRQPRGMRLPRAPVTGDE